MDIAVVGAGISLTLGEDGVCTAAVYPWGLSPHGLCWSRKRPVP
jgi:hypothetical protein